MPHAADGKRARRYANRTPDTIALKGDTEAETRRNVSVAAVVSTLHRLGATGVNHTVQSITLEGDTVWAWTFTARMRDGRDYEGRIYTSLNVPDSHGIALMLAGAALIRNVMDRQEKAA